MTLTKAISKHFTENNNPCDNIILHDTIVDKGYFVWVPSCIEEDRQGVSCSIAACAIMILVLPCPM